MANKQRNAGKEVFWRDALKRHASSGLSARAFCRREMLAESAFYAWRRTLARRDVEATAANVSAFVPVVIKEPAPRVAAIEIELSSGRVLRLPAAIMAERLAELVQALEARGPR